MISRATRFSFVFLFLVFFDTLKNTDSFRLSYEDEKKSESVVPPPSNKPALMGRFIVNQAEWTSIATISTREDVVSYPIVNLKAVSDGPLGNGTGVPYMFLSPLDFSVQDLERDNRASLLMTLAQGPYCKDKGMDPMDPRCPRIILTGKVMAVEKSSWEYEVAKDAVFGRHPWLAHVPDDHHFYFAKLHIKSIAVLARFGAASMVPIEEYFGSSAL